LGFNDDESSPCIVGIGFISGCDKITSNIAIFFENGTYSFYGWVIPLFASLVKIRNNLSI